MRRLTCTHIYLLLILFFEPFLAVSADSSSHKAPVFDFAGLLDASSKQYIEDTLKTHNRNSTSVGLNLATYECNDIDNLQATSKAAFKKWLINKTRSIVFVFCNSSSKNLAIAKSLDVPDDLYNVISESLRSDGLAVLKNGKVVEGLKHAMNQITESIKLEYDLPRAKNFSSIQVNKIVSEIFFTEDDLDTTQQFNEAIDKYYNIKLELMKRAFPEKSLVDEVFGYEKVQKIVNSEFVKIGDSYCLALGIYVCRNLLGGVELDWQITWNEIAIFILLFFLSILLASWHNSKKSKRVHDQRIGEVRQIWENWEERDSENTIRKQNEIRKQRSLSLEGKKCGSCYAPVSLGASVGDRCPSCGVQWNTSKTTEPYINVESLPYPLRPNYWTDELTWRSNLTYGFNDKLKEKLRPQYSKIGPTVVIFPVLYALSLIALKIV